MDRDYYFPIDLATNDTPFGTKSIGKGSYNPILALINKIQDYFLCVYVEAILPKIQVKIFPFLTIQKYSRLKIA